MTKSVEGPAFYATGQRSTWRDVRAVLHPPYTAWHLSYVVLGAMIAPRVNWTTLIVTLIAFLVVTRLSRRVAMLGAGHVAPAAQRRP